MQTNSQIYVGKRIEQDSAEELSAKSICRNKVTIEHFSTDMGISALSLLSFAARSGLSLASLALSAAKDKNILTRQPSMKLKILTYNIHKGFDWGKRNYFLADIKRLVKASKANIVFLQEVVGESKSYKKKGLVDSQFEFIADSVWSHYSYAQNAIHDHGHHGNLILSEYPIASWKNVNISTNSLEKRGLLVCKIEIPSKESSKEKRYIHVICAHLDLLQKGRAKQYDMLRSLVESLEIPDNDPLIVAGDFNDWNQEAHHILEKELKCKICLYNIVAKFF